MILKSDIIGHASKIVYGRTGDSVQIEKVWQNMFLVKNKDGIRFFVKCQDICVTNSPKKQ